MTTMRQWKTALRNVKKHYNQKPLADLLRKAANTGDPRDWPPQEIRDTMADWIEDGTLALHDLKTGEPV